ncbi:MAG: CBS domain-containing protein [Nitrososphaerota archaeon]
MLVKEVMKKNVITIDAEKTIEEACKIMGEKHIGSLIVTINDEPRGIFTERDLVSKVISKNIDIKKAKVKEYMSSPLIFVKPDIHIKEAAKIMVEMHIRRLPVIENDKLVGIFTSSDFVEAICKYPFE